MATQVVDRGAFLHGVAQRAGGRAQTERLRRRDGRLERDGGIAPGATQRRHVAAIRAPKPCPKRGGHRRTAVGQIAGEAVVVPLVVDAVVGAVGEDTLRVGRGLQMPHKASDVVRHRRAPRNRGEGERREVEVLPRGVGIGLRAGGVLHHLVGMRVHPPLRRLHRVEAEEEAGVGIDAQDGTEDLLGRSEVDRAVLPPDPSRLDAHAVEMHPGVAKHRRLTAKVLVRVAPVLRAVVERGLEAPSADVEIRLAVLVHDFADGLFLAGKHGERLLGARLAHGQHLRLAKPFVLRSQL